MSVHDVHDGDHNSNHVHHVRDGVLHSHIGGYGGVSVRDVHVHDGDRSNNRVLHVRDDVRVHGDDHNNNRVLHDRDDVRVHGDVRNNNHVHHDRDDVHVHSSSDRHDRDRDDVHVRSSSGRRDHDDDGRDRDDSRIRGIRKLRLPSSAVRLPGYFSFPVLPESVHRSAVPRVW